MKLSINPRNKICSLSALIKEDDDKYFSYEGKKSVQELWLRYVKQFYQTIIKDMEIKQFVGCSMSEKKIVFIVASENRIWMELFFEDILRDKQNFIKTPMKIELSLTVNSALIK